MNDLEKLENKSVFIIREAYRKFKRPAVLWSIGKDSTVLVSLVRKALPAGAEIDVIHIDTKKKFQEIYEFRDEKVKEWNLNLHIATIDKPKAEPVAGNKVNCCNERKTQALKNFLKENDFDALLVGIRRDEHGVRAKERYFSPRDKEFHWNVAKEKLGGDSGLEAMQDTELSGWNLFESDFGETCNHVRVHPILHWTELEIWEYIRKRSIPMVSLYFAKNFKRYRSIGCECCCEPVDSNATNLDKIIQELKETNTAERAGRAQDKENANVMAQLRALGYM